MATDPAAGQPPPPPPAPESPPAESAPGEIPSTPDERQMAMLAHWGVAVPFLGPAVPLGLWAAKMGQSAFIEDQAKEALNLGINVLMLGILVTLTMAIWWGLFIIPLAFFVVNGIFCFQAGMAAKEGRVFRYTYNVRYIS